MSTRAFDRVGIRRAAGRLRGLLLPLFAPLLSPLSPAAALTLQDALGSARANDASLAAAKAERSASRAATREVWASWLPVVEARQVMTHLDDATVARANLFTDALAPFDTLAPPPDLEIPEVNLDDFRLYQDSQRSEITASWALWAGGARTAALRAAHAGEALADESVALQSREVELTTKLAFLGARQATRQVAVARADLERVAAYVEVSGQRLAVGKGTELDHLQWQVAAAAARAAVARAAADLAEARAELAQALGRQLGAAEELEPVVDARDLPEVVRVEQLWCGSAASSAADSGSFAAPGAAIAEWEATLGKRAPAVRAAAAAADLAAAAVGGATAQLLPTVGVAGSLAWQANRSLALDGYREWHASLVISVPLLPFAGAWFDRAEASAAAAAQRWRVVDATREAQRELAARVARVGAALAERRHAREEGRLAAAAFAAAERAFRAGLAGRLELEDARVALRRAELAAIAAEAQVRAEAALLRFLVGDDALFGGESLP